MTRVLVCGGRDFANYGLVDHVLTALDERHIISVIIEGGASGADRFGKDWGETNWCKVETYRADWDAYGPSAGPIRNKRMLVEGKPDIVVAFPGGRGTANMMRQARDAGVRVIEVME